jgi:signal transduction histidine kinase/Tfp pilus assembly protein PilF
MFRTNMLSLEVFMRRTLPRAGALCIVLLMTLGTSDGPASIPLPRSVEAHFGEISAPHPGRDSLRRTRPAALQEARTQYVQGLLLYKRSSYDSALTFFTEARRLFTIARSLYGTSQSELSRGNVFLKRAELDSARQCFIAARRLAEAYKDDIAIAESYLGLATWFRETRSKDSAWVLLSLAQTVFKQKGERIKEADAHVTRGGLHMDLGQHVEARDEYERAIPIYESAGQLYHLAFAVMNKANAQSQLGQGREALSLYLRSDSLFSEIGNTRERATLAGNIAKAHMGLKQSDAARLQYMRQLGFAREVDDHTLVVSALMGLGSHAIDHHQYGTAAEFLIEALKEAESIKDHKLIGNVLGNIGRMNLFTGDYDKAEQYYRRALSHHRQVGHLNGIFYCLGGLATLEEKLGRLDAALVHRIECVRIAEQTTWSHQIAMAKRNLGTLLTKRGDSDSGRVLIEEAITMFLEHTSQSIGCSYNDLGVALEASRQDSLAEVMFRQAVQEAERSGETRCLKSAHDNLASFYRRHADSARALRHLLVAVDLRDSLNSKERITTMQELQTRYETEKQRITISLLEKNQEVSRLHIQQQEQELTRRSLLAEQQRQRILLFERDDRIKELLLRQKSDSLANSDLTLKGLSDRLSHERERAASSEFERNVMVGGSALMLALAFLLVRRFQGKRRETQLLAEALDHKARAAKAEAIRAHADALQREHEAQAQYTRLLIQSQEDERRRLSRELHDGLGQSLTVLRNSALLGLRGDDVDVMRRQLEGISGMIADTIDEVRSMTRDLRPVQLEHLGLTGTLRGILARIAEETPLHVTHEIDDLDGLFRPNDEINVFRLVQEAMSNMLRHAQARSASVKISHDNGHVDIAVLDDGIGFNPTALDVRSGLGIRGMHERVAMLHGTLAIDSAPHRGTRVHIRLPIDR